MMSDHSDFGACDGCGNEVHESDLNDSNRCPTCTAKEGQVMNPELRQRIADALGWTVEDTEKFSLAALRDFLPERKWKLKHELNLIIQSGSHIIGEPIKTRRFR